MPGDCCAPDPLGFMCERMDSGPGNFRVRNLWAIRRSASPALALWYSQGTRTLCRPARWISGRAIRSRRGFATANFTAAAQRT